MPAGCRLYVSGQAEKGNSLREATRLTLDKLLLTLKQFGRAQEDIVQLKCFIQPMSSVAEVQDEINRYFSEWPGVVVPRRLHPGQAPPTVFVEWKQASPPIEIELIVSGGPARDLAKESIEFITPHNMTKSPVFSRVTRINRGPTIFIGDVFGEANASAEAQLQSSFDKLGQLLKESGSDFKHLAKATYYVTDDEISKAHNAIRPKYFDPDRPPAASKALVGSTGRPGVRYSMDMIAVPSAH
jgi:enamine deaminase RidA (YjgF/YER057c/UK114 family)